MACDGSAAGAGPAVGAGPSSGAGSAAGAEIDAIRRSWPDILEALGRRSKLARAIVSSNAVPQGYAGGVLTLGFNNQGSVSGFTRGANAAKLAESVAEVLGIEARVEVGEVGAAVDRGPSGSGGGGSRGPALRRPSREEVDSVVGPRAADREPVDHEKFWQTPPPSGAWSTDAPADDDAEGDPTAERSGPRPADDRDAGRDDAPAVDPAPRAEGAQGAGRAPRPYDWTPPHDGPRSQDGPVDGDAARAEGASDAADAPAAERDPVSSTSAGTGAVDAPFVAVPPPADIPDYPYDDEFPDDGEDGFGEPVGGADGGLDGGTGDDPGGGAELSPAPRADDDLDFLGAYADPDIAFTSNGNGEPPPVDPEPRDARADHRFAHLAARHGTVGHPADGGGAPPAPPEPDPVENYVDYDTEGDLDISEAPEFGVPVVERILGGVVIEEIDG